MADIIIGANLVWGLISILFGILILAAPKLLNFLVAIYLIISGIVLIVAPAMI